MKCVRFIKRSRATKMSELAREWNLWLHLKKNESLVLDI